VRGKAEKKGGVEEHAEGVGKEGGNRGKRRTTRRGIS
jgi:hypothetical protein